MSTGVLLASATTTEHQESCHLVPWGAAEECSFPAPDSTIFDFDPAFTLTLGNLTLHFTKPMIMLWLGALIVIVVFTLAFRKAKIIPRGLQNIADGKTDPIGPITKAVAAQAESEERMLEEAADLAYHLALLLVNRNLGCEDVDRELRSRYDKH